jgi:HAD superfamily hydrolase (TIGR01450 family)
MAAMTWALDLDGVVWLADTAIPGSAAAVERLRARGERVVFLTNNSSLTLAEYTAKLQRLGVPAEAGDLATSAQAAASLVAGGETALVCAGPGVEEALRQVGATTVRDGKADVVVVGWHRDFDYERLTAACWAVEGGARLIGTNDDATYPTPDGPLPGGGAILAAVAYATGVTPVVAGKPNQPLADLVAARFGAITVMVGDRPSTDGLMAERMQARFALVLTGVTRPADLPVVPAPDVVAADLAELVEGLDQKAG